MHKLSKQFSIPKSPPHFPPASLTSEKPNYVINIFFLSFSFLLLFFCCFAFLFPPLIYFPFRARVLRLQQHQLYKCYFIIIKLYTNTFIIETYCWNTDLTGAVDVSLENFLLFSLLFMLFIVFFLLFTLFALILLYLLPQTGWFLQLLLTLSPLLHTSSIQTLIYILCPQHIKSVTFSHTLYLIFQ